MLMRNRMALVGFVVLAVVSIAGVGAQGLTPALLSNAALTVSDFPPEFRQGRSEGSLPGYPVSYARDFRRMSADATSGVFVGVALIADPALTPETAADLHIRLIATGMLDYGPGLVRQPAEATGGGVLIRFQGTNVNGVTFTGATLAWRQGPVVGSIFVTGTAGTDAAGLAATYARLQMMRLNPLVQSQPAPTATPPATPTAATMPPSTNPVPPDPTSAEEPPTPPGNLRVQSVGSTSLVFAWDASPAAEFYWVYAPDDGGYTRLTGSVTTFILTGLSPNSYHCLLVIASNGTGYSAWSNWACATTTGAAGD